MEVKLSLFSDQRLVTKSFYCNVVSQGLTTIIIDVVWTTLVARRSDKTKLARTVQLPLVSFNIRALASLRCEHLHGSESVVVHLELDFIQW